MTGPTIGGTRHYSPSIHWNDQLDKFIVNGALSKFSIAEISKRLAAEHGIHASRNSIIGRLTRLKFKNPNPVGFREGNQNCNAPLVRKERKPKSEIHDREISISKSSSSMPVMDDHRSGTISLAHARERDCRYPVGYPRELRICGQPIESGSSYCREHILRCFANIKPVQTFSAGVPK